MKYDVMIIGAGPGGIFSAYELTRHNPNIKVAVFEGGHELKKRRCPIDGDKVKSCIRCNSCSIMSGFGGAGAFSDGKYNITNNFGGTLHEYIGKARATELMHYVDDINMAYGGEGTKLYSTTNSKFKKLCLQNKLNLLDASVRHLGTDKNYIVLSNLYNELKDKVDFYCRYVDDIRLIDKDKARLERAVKLIERNLNGMKLKIHPKKCRVQEIHKGVKFIGAYIMPHRLYITNRVRNKFYNKILCITLQRPLHGKSSAKHGSTANRNHQRRQQV